MYNNCNHSHFCNNNREFREYELYRGLGGVGGFGGNRRPDLGIDRRLDRLEPIFPESAAMLPNSYNYREFHGDGCWRCGCGRGYSENRRSDICIDRRFDRLEPIPSATATILPNNYNFGGEFGENKTISGFGSGGRYFGNRRLEPISSANATMLPKCYGGVGGEFRDNKTISEFGSGGGYFGSRRFDTRSNFSRSPVRPQNVKTADVWPRDRPKPIASSFGNKDQKALVNSNNKNNNNNNSNISNNNTGSCRNGRSGGRGSRGRNSGERSQNKPQDEGGQRQRFGYDNDKRQSSSGVKKETSNVEDDWNWWPYTRNAPKPDGFGRYCEKDDYLLFNTGFGAPNHPWLNPVDNGFGFGFSHATSTRPSGNKVGGFGGNSLDKKTVPDTIQKKDNHNQAGTLNGLSENTLFDGGFSRHDNRGFGDRGRDSEKHRRTPVRPDGRFCPDHVKTANMWDILEPKPAVNKDDDW